MSEQRRLEQITIEERYSKRNIRRKLKEKILGAEVLVEPMNNATAALNEWLYDVALKADGNVWETKQARKTHVMSHYLEENDIESIVLEMMLIIMPMTGAQSIQGIAGRLGNLFGFHDVFDAVKTASEMIAIASDYGLFDIIHAADSETGTLLVKSLWDMDDEMLQVIADTKYLPPMIVPPNEVTGNMNKTRMSITESVILKAENHHEEYQNYDNLNLANSIALSLDENVLQYEEEASSDLDTADKVKGFQMLQISSRVVYDEIMDYGNEFYTLWKYDKRGREYSQGYHCHIQGSAYKKALINFHKKEIITL